MALVATMASFSACSNDAEEVLAQEREIRLTSEITPSRVTSDLQSTQIAEGQKIGVTITGSKSGNDYVNKLWTSDGEGSLSTTSTVYWANTDINVVAYHPYNEGWTSGTETFTVSNDQSDETNYLNSDLLFATSSANVEKKEDAVSLIFSHKLAKINVTLQPEYQEMDLSSAVISICNTKTSTTINLSDGTVPTEATGNVEEITAGTGKTVSAIVAPQTVSSGTKFIKVVLGSKTFYYTLPADKQLTSGYSHNYTLTVKETALEIENSSEINNWTPDDDEGNTGDANEDTSILTVTLAQAGTLGNYLTDANKNVIEKLKIIGDINGTDIQLIRNITICDGGGNPTEDTGALIYLDLSEANIVAGGSSYRAFTNDEVVNTENNIVTNGMFEYTNLETIILPDNITKIGARAFQVLKNMKRLIIPEGVTIIEREAFDTNYNLVEITLPESVEEIGDYAFSSCNKLQSIKLPNKVTTLGTYLFMSCSALNTITLPENLERINNNAFAHCTSLEIITIPNNVSMIVFRSPKQPKTTRNNQV